MLHQLLEQQELQLVLLALQLLEPMLLVDL